jgi:hypothetical protein
MQQQSFIIQLIKRWASENPTFWKYITRFGLIGAILIAGVLSLDKMHFFTLADNWRQLLQGIDGFFLGMFITGGAGTSDPKLLDNKTIEKVIEHNNSKV